MLIGPLASVEGNAEAFLLSRKSQLKVGQIAVYARVVQVDYIDRCVNVVATGAIQDNGALTGFAVPYPLKLTLEPRPTRGLRAVVPHVGNAYGFVLPKTPINSLLATATGSVTQIWDPQEDTIELPPTGWAYPNDVISDPITVPIVFPVLGGAQWSDTFLANRDGGKRQHLGQDLMSPKMTPLVAAIEGVVLLKKGKTPTDGNSITITREDGWRVVYLHVNCDNPGTADGKGSDLYAFAPGLRTGDFVREGQFVGWVGDSGNARGGPSHCHFEIRRSGVINAAPSLNVARKVDGPTPEIAQTALPSEGELRVDGVLTFVDPATLRAQCVVAAEIQPSGAVGIVTAPTFLDINFGGAELRHRLDFSLRVEPRSLFAGSRVSLYGQRGPSNSFVVKHALVIPEVEPAGPTTPVNPPPLDPKPKPKPDPVTPAIDNPTPPRPPVTVGKGALDLEIDRAREREGMSALGRMSEYDAIATELLTSSTATDIGVTNALRACTEKGLLVQEAMFVCAPTHGDNGRAIQMLLSSFRSRAVILDGKWTKMGNAVSGERIGWLFVRK